MPECCVTDLMYDEVDEIILEAIDNTAELTLWVLLFS